MIREYTNLDMKLQTNRFDLSLQDILLIKRHRMIDFSNVEQRILEYISLESNHSKYHLQ